MDRCNWFSSSATTSGRVSADQRLPRCAHARLRFGPGSGIEQPQRHGGPQRVGGHLGLEQRMEAVIGVGLRSAQVGALRHYGDAEPESDRGGHQRRRRQHRVHQAPHPPCQPELHADQGRNQQRKCGDGCEAMS